MVLYELKQVDYPGNFTQGRSELFGKVAYLLQGEEVYFTATKRGPSTINFAEQIVKIICDEEGIDWRNYTFYDFQTVWGYPSSWRKLEDYCIDRLSMEERNDQPVVTGWFTIAQSSGWGSSLFQSDLQDAVPAWVIEAFQGFLVSAR